MIVGLSDLTLDQLEALTLAGLESLPLDSSATTQTLNMFVKGVTPRSKTDSLDLTMTALPSGVENSINQLNLFVRSDDPYGVPLNLYTSGYSEPGSAESSLNLYVAGHGTSVENSLSCITYGGYGGGLPVLNSLSLYVSGDGISDGYTPVNTGMNLYLQGGIESTNSITLFVEGKEPGSQSLNLYTYGVTGSSNNSVNLYIQGKDSSTNSLNLFTRGYRTALQIESASSYLTLSEASYLTLTEAEYLFLTE